MLRRIRAIMTIFLFLGMLMSMGCGDEGDEGGNSKLGESCTKTDDCESGLRCVDLECVEDDSSSNDDDDDIADGDNTNYTAEGTWYDSSTGLTWENPAASGDMVWSSAKSYCQNLSLAGGGWRLPTISELRSLIRGCSATGTGGSCGVTDSCLSHSCRSDICNGCEMGEGPASDGCYWPSELEGDCLFGFYWSSSPMEDLDDWGWVVPFNGAWVLGDALYQENPVRCVR